MLRTKFSILALMLAIGFFGVFAPDTSQAANNCEGFSKWPKGLTLLNAPKNPTLNVPPGTVQLSKTQTKFSSLGPTIILDNNELESQGFFAGSTAFFYSSIDDGKTWSCDVSYTTVSNSIPTRANGNTLVIVYLVDNTATRLAVTPLLTVQPLGALAQQYCAEKNLVLDVIYDGTMFVAKVKDTKAITTANNGFKTVDDGADIDSVLTNNDASFEKLALYEKCAKSTYSSYEIQFSINNFKSVYKYRDVRVFSHLTGETDPAIIFALKKGAKHQFRAVPVNKDRSSRVLKTTVTAKDTRKFCDKPENRFATKCTQVKVS